MTRVRFLFASAVAGLLFLGSPALLVVAVAQDLEFEQVGNQPINAKQIQVDSDGTLWGSDISALWRLSPTKEWEEIGSFFGSYLLVLTPDTLFLGNNAGTQRTVDGGENFNPVYEEGGHLFAADPSGPNAGVILCGANIGGTGIAYSTDRGATFTEATITVSTNWRSTLHTAVEIPDGPAAGRLVAGVFNGVVVSEDGGQTWEPSSLFQDGRFVIQNMVIGRHPATENRRIYASVTDVQDPDIQLYVSDDDGLTWSNPSTMPFAYLFVFVPGGGGLIGGDALLAVEKGTSVEEDRITLWRSVDGGVTWTEAGNLPAEPMDDGISSSDMLVGPEGHLYVSVSRTGPEREWVYRTTEPVVVANEPEAPPSPVAERLVVYPNPATDRITVETNGLDEEVVLYDLLGRAVRRASLVAGKTVLDTSALPAGVYVVRVGGESRVVTIRR